MITVRQQMRASGLATAAAAPSADASAPFGGASQPTPAQFEREVHRALDAGMATRASQAEAAGSEP
jgi:hypothetical protein